MTLYLKYRPQNLDELDLVGVRDSLKKIISSKNIPHAFLFSGPKGTGKTSTARIVAKIINCEKGNLSPCDKCEQCVSIMKGNNLDVIELDAASHRGIDDIRILRDAVKLAPTRAKKKVYIIDEAHMLTTEASNALLKTLEEPPSHVVFILATTNPEKLIGTIHSRTTNVNFTKATTEEIVRSLERVAKGEKVKVGTDVLEVVSKASGGAFRDGVKIFEQLLSEKIKLETEEVTEFLFKRKGFNLDEFIDLLAKKDVKGLLTSTQNFISKGVGVDNVLEEIVSRLRLALLSKVGIGDNDLKYFSKGDLIVLIELLSQASNNLSDSLIDELPLELAIIKWCDGPMTVSEIGNSQEEPQIKKAEKQPTPEELTSPAKTVKVDEVLVKEVVKLENLKELSEELWKKVLVTMRPINASIEALLRASKPLGYDGKNLTVGVFYKFHKERLEDGHHRRVLEDVIASVLGNPVRVVCTLTEPPIREVKEEAKIETVLTESRDQDIIKVAQDIFGS